MAMTIDDDIEMLEYIHGGYRRGCRIAVALEHTISNLRKYQKIQADYNARLKADMVAMLIELKNKLIDRSWNIDMYDDNLDFECCYLNDIDKLIQQIIDKYKAESEEE